MATPTLQEWYSAILSRRVDLVGDYAGNELFIVEGDSLLLHCFTDPRIDLRHGYQLLHAVYCVEKFLFDLQRRKCNFHIVFLASHRDLCIPPSQSSSSSSSTKSHHARYRLARSAIISHLRRTIPSRVYVFGSPSAPDLWRYMNDAGVYFAMCHDGALEEETEEAVTESGFVAHKVAFRQLIRLFISKGYNVALINDVTFADTKVFSMILEGSGHSNPSRALAAEQQFETETETETDPSMTTTATYPLLENVLSTGPAGRDAMTVAAVSGLLRDEEISPGEAAALVLSSVLLDYIPLANRGFRTKSGSASQIDALEKFILALSLMAEEEEDQKTMKNFCCADMVDGRLFFSLDQSMMSHCLSHQSVSARFSHLCTVTKTLVGIDLLKAPPVILPQEEKPEGTTSDSERKSQFELSVLPFDNPVFNKHLAPVHLQVDPREYPLSAAKSRIFKQLSHWHNHKVPLIRKGDAAKSSKWALTRNQRFMKEMLVYAESLINVSGRALEPESIVVDSQTAKKSKKPSREKTGGNNDEDRPRQPQHPKKGAKEQPLSNKEKIKEQVKAAKEAKSNMKAQGIIRKWDEVRKEFDAEADHELRYVKTRKYLAGLTADSASVLEVEIHLYSIKSLVSVWKKACDLGNEERSTGVAALVWNLCSELQRSDTGLSESTATELNTLTADLHLPLPRFQATADQPRKLPFSLTDGKKVEASKTKRGKAYGIDLPPRVFQLQHCGPYLDRRIDSKPDDRVPFQPDGWQRDVLDAIDQNKSLFVVAPTSAGKTFISFYAMRQVLKASDDGVVVYVAPTKALVNQIAAEVQGRFSKTFKADARSVWGIHTRDYRINNPTGCQVLITVPHILQIMLLSPSNCEKKNPWAYRIKRIIFDEVHCIGQADDGLVWEQLLLQAWCPIVALSATVGNPKEFSEWLESTQRACGNELVTVEHHTRYSDLRKFIYNAPRAFDFTGLTSRPLIQPLGLDGSDAFAFVHPVAALVNRSRGIPRDLSLEARDCYLLWQALQKHQAAEYPVPESLSPGSCLPVNMCKADVLKWEKELKDLLRAWIAAKDSPYDKVIGELQPVFSRTWAVAKRDLLDTTLPLLVDLHSQDALPAIVFSFDRSICEALAAKMVGSLAAAESKWKDSSSDWKRKIDDFEKYTRVQEKLANSATKIQKKKTKKKKKGSRDDDDDEDATASRADYERSASGTEESKWASFDPDAPLQQFSFADGKKLPLSELHEYQSGLRHRGVSEWLITALNRGVGVHHAGMNRMYRHVVEILFRKGFLGVVIATGTLALGINMPCKTVVFAGDSVFLTALNYRQCAGRAGRRGFDVLGNVVFHGLPYSKICMLLSSRLPDLNGHFPITTSLVLRLTALLHESKNSEFAVRSIDAILSQPRFVLGGSEEKSAVLHHLRFSFEYLRRQNLLGRDGTPLNFAGLASHLYYAEASAWAFHALMKEGYLYKLASNFRDNPKKTGLTLMLVLSHIFGRSNCRRADAEFYDEYVKRSSSIVFLPDLPSGARRVLEQHNKETLDIFLTYVRTYAEQHLGDTPDNRLPLTGTVIGPSPEGDDVWAAAFPEPTSVRSHFVALSGHRDGDFQSISDLCTSVRGGVFLEEAAIPYLPIWNKGDVPLNAYLYDFYKHGDVTALTKGNRLKRGDLWFVLNDFSLVLATIVTNLANHLKLPSFTGGDLIEILGAGDEIDEELDDMAYDKQERQKSGAVPVTAAPAAKAKGARVRVEESWEMSADALDQGVKGELELGSEDDEDSDLDTDGNGLMNVLLAFQHVKTEFDAKFKAIWA
ncbi:P-loop containing nucleoside triphosphate hydrolase protein [Xylariaceae sp. FL0594]|nr:P-loop containing nucleoside triphosphate hydrolase protein [Xylariaceae sp. FL0594]